jgi:hypothetical protein
MAANILEDVLKRLTIPETGKFCAAVLSSLFGHALVYAKLYDY